MKTVTRKRYTPEFKAQALNLVALGKAVPEVAQELEISDGLLYSWVRKGGQPAQFGSAGERAGGEHSEADELRRLRRQLAHLQMENNILKKAAIILGTNPLPENMR